MAESVERSDRMDRSEWIEVAVPEASRVFRRVYESYFARFGINLTQALLIGRLDIAEDHALNQTELARLVGLRKAATGTAIDGLVARGYVSRLIDPNDGRAKLVSLTAKGRELATAIDRAFGELAAVSRTSITQEQRRILVHILDVMRNNLEKFEADTFETGTFEADT